MNSGARHHIRIAGGDIAFDLSVVNKCYKYLQYDE